MQNYDLFIEKIVRTTGIKREEVEERVEKKKEKLSGLISKEGAAQIIAAELGVSFENQDLKVDELMSGMRRVNIVGKIINLFPVREYDKNGNKGKVANLIMADETGSTRIVLWDVNHIELIENGTIKDGDVIEIKNASTRDGEVHLSGFSELKKSSVVFDNIKSEAVVSEKSLSEAIQGQSIRVRGVVVQVFQPRFYSVCPQCNKKAINEENGYKCVEHGVISPKEKAILNFVLDDGTETMRVVVFSDQINVLIPEEDLKDAEKATVFRDDFIGTEIYLSGNVKRNQLFNNLEIVAFGVEKIDVEKLITELNS